VRLGRTRGRLLVISHPAVVSVNQSVYVALRDLGWQPRIVVPSRWRHEYSPESFGPTSLPGMEDVLLPKRVILEGRPQRHLYLASPMRVIRAVQPNVAFVEEETFSVPAFQWGFALMRAGVPFGVQAAENLDRPLPAIARAIRRWVLGHAAFVAARSPAAAQLAKRWGARGDVVLAAHAVPEWRVPERASTNGFTVGFAGRLALEKGLIDLLDAARLLDPPANLLLVGDGPLRNDLERADLAGGKITVQTGLTHERMPEAYARMNVLVLPSRTTPQWTEQFGRVLVEALWCGVPVVGSDSGEIPWVINTTGGGRVVPEADPGALAAALADLRDHPKERDALAERGRAAAQRLFSVSAAASALDAALLGARKGEEGG
jgi:glycosyltransferase involved in cell wall biosynthesis